MIMLLLKGEKFDYPTGDTENTFNYNGIIIKMTPFNRVLFSIYERNA